MNVLSLIKKNVMNMDITTSLLEDISDLIDRAKDHISTQFNSTLVLGSVNKIVV